MIGIEVTVHQREQRARREKESMYEPSPHRDTQNRSGNDLILLYAILLIGVPLQFHHTS